MDVFQGESVADNSSTVYGQLFFVARQFLISFLLNKYFNEVPKDQNVRLLCCAIFVSVKKYLEENGRSFATYTETPKMPNNRSRGLITSTRQPGDAPIPRPTKKVKFSDNVDDSQSTTSHELRKVRVQCLNLNLQMNKLTQAHEHLKKQVEELAKDVRKEDP